MNPAGLCCDGFGGSRRPCAKRALCLLAARRPSLLSASVVLNEADAQDAAQNGCRHYVNKYGQERFDARR